MKFIDSHCHIDFPEFDHDRDAVVSHCGRLGVSKLIVPGVDAINWPRVLKTCKEYPGLYPALGLHPVFIKNHKKRDLAVLETTLAERDDIVAVGEIGLDARFPEAEWPAQQVYFEAQIAIAREAGLPIILHVVKTHEQVLHALKHAQIKGGVVHAFSGSLEQAKRFVNLGFKIGIGGMLSYEHSSKLRALAAQLPLDALVLETDAPDMSGVVCQGERNSPVYLPDYFRALVGVREESAHEIAEALINNTQSVFKL